MKFYLIRDRNCIFCHILRTGGTTVKAMLNSKRIGPHYNCPDSTWSANFVFGFVRNPFSRFVSAWHLFKRKINVDFDQFAEIAMDNNIPQFEFGRSSKKRYAANIRMHTLPMTHPSCGLAYCHFIGRYEEFKRDLTYVYKRIGYKPRFRLKHLHDSKDEIPYREYFSDELRQKMEIKYRTDLDTFGYEF